ncbi:MAG: 30S ribosomal protein S6 [Coriobacteriia bacterium]|nr:30S ribosomal protein S6 [Coriobacteriia bacterium]
MKAYELMVILDPSLEEEARAQVLDRVPGLLTANGATVDSVDDWGKRRLAHEVAGKSDGDYVVYQFHAPADSVAEVDRVLHITDQVIRYMLVRREDLD